MNVIRIPTYLASALLVCLLTSCNTTPSPPATMVNVYADDPVYQALSEAEASWYGTLQTAMDDPSGQGGPTYALAYGQEAQQMHAEGVGAQLEDFVRKKVVVKGKLVASGSAFVLWSASVKRHETGLLDWTFAKVTSPDENLSPYLHTTARGAPRRAARAGCNKLL